MEINESNKMCLEKGRLVQALWRVNKIDHGVSEKNYFAFITKINKDGKTVNLRWNLKSSDDKTLISTNYPISRITYMYNKGDEDTVDLRYEDQPTFFDDWPDY